MIDKEIGSELLKAAFRLPYKETVKLPDFTQEKPYKADPLKIELEPLPLDVEIKLLQKLSGLTQQAFEKYKPSEESQENLSMASVLIGLKDVLSGMCGFEWLVEVPALTQIILDHYSVEGYTEDTIKKLPLPKHLELIYLQIETDRRSSDVATDFFVQIGKKIPTLDVIIQMATVILSSTMSYNSSDNVAPSEENSD